MCVNLPLESECVTQHFKNSNQEIETRNEGCNAISSSAYLARGQSEPPKALALVFCTRVYGDSTETYPRTHPMTVKILQRVELELNVTNPSRKPSINGNQRPINHEIPHSRPCILHTVPVPYRYRKDESRARWGMLTFHRYDLKKR